MADSESNECPCSNIAIMQLFHELKQKFPKIPDQIVSKVIEQNFHNKTACEMILEKESHHYLQSYPGALISGAPRDPSDPLCKQCSAPRTTHRACHPSSVECERREDSGAASSRRLLRESITRCSEKSYDGRDCANGVRECTDKCGSKASHSERARKESGSVVSGRDVTNSREGGPVPTKSPSAGENGDGNSDQMFNSSSSSLGTYMGSFTEEEEEEEEERRCVSSENSAVITDRTSESGCDSETKMGNFTRSQSSIGSSSLKNRVGRGIETCRWSVEEGGRKSAVVSGFISRSSPSESPATHNYQLNLECSMQPIPLDSRLNRDHTRSFTSVNLCLRPPSSEPQPPIEIQSGQSLTYTTSSFDPKKGYQSQLQIRIEPALLEKQKERKDLLALELRREKEKLRFMQNEVRLMTAAIARRPDPEILPKLKADIVRLRAECEKLTAAVDLYSDNENAVPLGETNEEFYRNIYTGQRFQREGSWSCQLCKFRNHPLLAICEVCEMPRLSLGTAVRDVTSSLPNVCSNTNNPSLRTGAETSTSASLIIAPLQER